MSEGSDSSCNPSTFFCKEVVCRASVPLRGAFLVSECSGTNSKDFQRTELNESTCRPRPFKYFLSAGLGGIGRSPVPSSRISEASPESACMFPGASTLWPTRFRPNDFKNAEMLLSPSFPLQISWRRRRIPEEQGVVEKYTGAGHNETIGKLEAFLSSERLHLDRWPRSIIKDVLEAAHARERSAWSSGSREKKTHSSKIRRRAAVVPNERRRAGDRGNKDRSVMAGMQHTSATSKYFPPDRQNQEVTRGAKRREGYFLL